MEKHRQKELLTTWECLNYKKSWQELTSCVITTRDSLIFKMFSPIFCFEQEKALKKLSKKLCTSKIEKKKISWDEKKRLGLKNAKTSTNAQTFKWYETGMFIGLFSFLIISETLAYGLCATFLFLPYFDVICDLLLDRRMAAWNLFVKYIATYGHGSMLLPYLL